MSHKINRQINKLLIDLNRLCTAYIGKEVTNGLKEEIATDLVTLFTYYELEGLNYTWTMTIDKSHARLLLQPKDFKTTVIFKSLNLI